MSQYKGVMKWLRDAKRRGLPESDEGQTDEFSHAGGSRKEGSNSLTEGEGDGFVTEGAQAEESVPSDAVEPEETV